MVLPLLLILMFGIIDGGRWLWEYNRAEKATQAGARFAVVTTPVDTGIVNYGYVGATVDGVILTQGDRIPASGFGKLTCTNSACTCAAEEVCPGTRTYNGTAFTAIVDRMKLIDPWITPANVEVDYHGSGLGFAGDPNGMDVSPLVTVRLKGLVFRPITTLLFADINMPSFAATLTAEDAQGSGSN